MAADLTAKKSNLISKAIARFVALADARDALVALRAEYDALGYTFVDGDFVGANVHLDATKFVAGFTSQGNLETFWAAGNNTNLEKFRP
jgi:hypothetical protein